MAHVFELSFCALVREDFGVHNHVRRVHIKLSDVSPLVCDEFRGPSDGHHV